MTRSPRFSVDMQTLLAEVVSKYLPEDAPSVLRNPPETWARPLRVRARDAVGRELAATGLDSEYLPTERGNKLEALLDMLNRIELGPRGK